MEHFGRARALVPRSRAARKPMPAAAKANDPLKRRADLCGALLKVRGEHAVVFDRIDAINTELKAIAAEPGESFRETVVGVGHVSAAPRTLAETKAHFP